MAKILQPDFDQSPMEELKQYSDDFVALDIHQLSQKLITEDMDSAGSIQDSLKVVKILSRKASSSLRNDAAGEERNNTKSTDEGEVSPGGLTRSERSPAMVHVAIDGDATGFSHSATPPSAGAMSRRAGSSRRRPSTWLNSRRVPLVFASLSSMGTLILLYFMLSMGKMSDGDMAGR